MRGSNQPRSLSQSITAMWSVNVRPKTSSLSLGRGLRVGVRFNAKDGGDGGMAGERIDRGRLVCTRQAAAPKTGPAAPGSGAPDLQADVVVVHLALVEVVVGVAEHEVVGPGDVGGPQGRFVGERAIAGRVDAGA